MRLRGRGRFGLAGVIAAGAVLAAACSLLPQDPSISLSVPSAPFSSVTNISIPYQIVDESSSLFHSQGSENCQVTLEKQTDANFLTLTQYEQSLSTTGTLVFDLDSYQSTILSGIGTLNPTLNGTYLLIVRDYGTNNSQVTTPLASPVGQAEFQVLQPGETVLSAVPSVLNGSEGSETVRILGQGFSSAATVTFAGTAASSTYVNQGEIDATVDPNSVVAAGNVDGTLTVTDGTSSFNFLIWVTDPPFPSTIVLTPSSASRSSGNVLVEFTNGANLTTFTSVTMADSGGHSVAVTVDPRSWISTSPSYATMNATLGLGGAATGTALITLSNPDGSTPGTLQFTINP